MMFANNEEIKATTTPHRRVGFSRPGVGGLKSALQRQDSRSLAAFLQGAAIALAALLLAPNAALAAPGGLCGAQTTDGDPNTSDTITCDPTESYPDGINYSSDGGDLTLNEEFEATIDGKDVILMDVEDDGLNVTGTGDDDITFFAEPGTVKPNFGDPNPTRAGVTGSDGAVINYLSESGDIDITAGPVIATGSATHAIRAESTAGGNVGIVLGPAANGSLNPSGFQSPGTGIFARTTGIGTVDITGVGRANVSAGTTGIEAITEDGALSIVTTSSVGGDVTGIDATTATGAIDIDVGGSVKGGVTAIDASSTGGGAIDVAVAGSDFQSFQSSGTFLRTRTAGDTDILFNAFESDGDAATVESTGSVVVDAASTGAGDINITTLTPIEAPSRAIVADTSAGSGAINIDVTPGFTTRGAAVLAAVSDADGDAAIDAIGGDGKITINVTPTLEESIRIDAGTGVGIRTEAGSGGAEINLFRFDNGVDPAQGVFFATVTVNETDNDLASAVHMIAGEGATTLRNFNRLGHDGDENRNIQRDATATDAQVMLSGGGDGQILIDNQNFVFGQVDFSAMTGGGVTFRNDPDAEGWVFGDGEDPDNPGEGSFGGGDDLVDNRSLVVAGGGGERESEFVGGREVFLLEETSLDFAGGADAFDNAGDLIVGEATFRTSVPPTVGTPSPDEPSAGVNSSAPTTATLGNLETFRNSGAIRLGGFVRVRSFLFDEKTVDDVPPRKPPALNLLGTLPRQVFSPEMDCRPDPGALLPTDVSIFVSCAEDSTLGESDGKRDDVLSMPNTNFIGEEGSIIYLDAAMTRGVGQSACDPRLEADGGVRGGKAKGFNMPAADCVDLRGGSTDGSTEIAVRDTIPGDLGSPVEIVVVDVNGGTSAAGHFILSPQSDNYDPSTDGIDKGLFQFGLAYDSDDQQHVLVGIPGRRAKHMTLLAQTAQQAARNSTDGWFGRRSGLEDVTGADEHGVWAYSSTDGADYDARQFQAFPIGEGGVVYNNEHDQDITTLTMGVDWLRGDDGNRSWNAGPMFGYARARLDFDETADRADFDGGTFGFYGSYGLGDFYVDAMVNNTWLEMHYDSPTLELFPEGTILSTDSKILTARTEAGWRLALSDALRVEPLAALSWVRADIDEMRIPGDDPSRTEGDNRVFGQGDDPTSLRAALGGRVAFDHALPAVRLNYALTARIWEELDGETDLQIESRRVTDTGEEGRQFTPVSDEFDGTFSEVSAKVGISNVSGSVSGSLSVDGTFHEDYESLGAELGFRYQW